MNRGFTLIETVVALALAATLALLAHSLFGGATRTTILLREQRIALDQQANGRRLLRELAINLDMTGAPFAGREGMVAFRTWHLSTRGRWRRADVTITASRGSLVITGLDGPITIDSIAGVRFDYLLARGEASLWHDEWTSPVTPPLAIRLRLTRLTPAADAPVDTLLLLVGERG